MSGRTLRRAALWHHGPRRTSGGAPDGSMRTCRPSLPTWLMLAALCAAPAALAGGIAATASAARPAVAAVAAAPAHRRLPAPKRHDFTPVSLRELVKAKFPGSPASFLPQGWEPAASSSYAGDLHRTTIDLGLRRQFSGRQSAQLGARITVFDCISFDNAGRFALGSRGSKVHGLIGFNYRY